MERKLDILRDHEWAGPLPIYAYLAEHPQGAFVVDTRDRARNSDREYPPKLNPFFQYKVKIKVAPEEEIGDRLRRVPAGRPPAAWPDGCDAGSLAPLV